MFKTILIYTSMSAVFVATPALANQNNNQPQDHRSTINQQQHNQVGQPIDNRIDAQIRQNDNVTPVTPPATRSLPTAPSSSPGMTPEPPPPPPRPDITVPQPAEPSMSTPSTTIPSPSRPSTTYPDARFPDGGYSDDGTPYR